MAMIVRWGRDHGRHDRLASAVGVAVLHALLAYALITGLRLESPAVVADRLTVFDVRELPPPPPEEDAAPGGTPAETKKPAASPPNVEAQPAPIVAPPREVRLEVPSPVAAAPVADTAADSAAGAANVAGPGQGAGGVGTGGGQGSGRGGIATRSRLVRGRIVDGDYPRGASRVGAGGAVLVRFTVQEDGRVRGCSVMRTSGNAELDATTCRLIERRFRYEPAHDVAGVPVPEVRGWRQVWWLEPRRGGPAPQARE